ncbi:S41 family peptidase [Kallipyga gabonensis]|uniref:S41 family peptidase n=1 Tax=Kallipyga gabonensis TaxID=1686287 RepID=UPI00138DDE85|nr:S41 family peptidase [Kallipyga gabonensis]
MKKIGKVLLLIILLVGFSLGGYFLGANSRLETPLAGIMGEEPRSQEMERILKNIENYSKIIKRDYIFDYKDEDLETGIYKGLFAGLGDPYSEYYTKEEYEALLEDTSGSFAGIGLVVTAGEDNLITVVSPIEGTPAAKAGIRSGDKILAVDGTTYLGSELNEATKAMRGTPGTEVTITIRREGTGVLKNEDKTLTRAEINVKTVNAKLLEDQVGYVQVTQFNETTAEEFDQALRSLMDQGAEHLVLDLRNNPGGLLDMVITMADNVLGEGKIVTTVDKQKKEDVATSDKEHIGIPMVVLVNEGSASASEIMTGALKDNNRALVLGKTTFGKGIVQRIYPLGAGKGGGFKLTMAEYLTPKGTHIHEVGIAPDLDLDLNEEAKGIGPDFLDQDNQLRAAMALVKTLTGDRVDPAKAKSFDLKPFLPKTGEEASSEPASSEETRSSSGEDSGQESSSSQPEEKPQESSSAE